MCCCLEYLTHQCYFVKLSGIFYYVHGYCSSGLANSMPPTPTTPNFLLILTPILSTSLFQELPVATFSILFSSTFDHSIFFSIFLSAFLCLLFYLSCYLIPLLYVLSIFFLPIFPFYCLCFF